MTFEEDIQYCIDAINAGGIILYPTDTVWGIGCDATNTAAIKKIYELKKREEQKSMIILVAYATDILKYVLHPSRKIMDFIAQQQSPVTAIFKQAMKLPASLINIDGSIAIRIVKDPFCEAILKKLNRPLVSTSANISGEATPANFAMVSNEIKTGVDYIAQHRQNEFKMSQPSMIIRLDDDNEIVRIR